MIVFNMRNMNEQEKKEVFLFIEKMLVAQAAEQHKEIEKEWTHGKIANWTFLQKDDYPDRVLAIMYEDGTWFRYYEIDLGAENMIVKEGLE